MLDTMWISCSASIIINHIAMKFYFFFFLIKSSLGITKGIYRYRYTNIDMGLSKKPLASLC